MVGFDPGVGSTFVLYFPNERFVLIHKCNGGWGGEGEDFISCNWARIRK